MKSIIQVSALFFALLLPRWGSSQSVVLSSGYSECLGQTAQYEVNGNTVTSPSYVWTLNSGGTVIGSNTSSSFKVNWTSSTGSLQVAVFPGGSSSPNYTRSYSVQTTPFAPTPGLNKFCGNGSPMSVHLTASKPSNASTLKWYDANGNFLGSGDYFDTSPITVTTGYKVSSFQSSGSCESSKVSFNAVINPIPGTPTGSVITAPCVSGTALLGGSPGLNGDEVVWVDLPNSPFAGSQGTTGTITTNTTYHIFTRNSSTQCVSAQVPIVATVNPLPSIPTNVVDGRRWGDGAVTLSATPDAGATLKWYAVLSGGSSLATAGSYSPTITQNTTYYLSSFNTTTGCESGRVSANAIIRALNSVVTYNVLSPNITDLSTVGSLTINEETKSTAYLDGLGRPIQNVTKRGSPGGYDIVSPLRYDNIGRERRKYLPFVSGQTGLFKPSEQVINSSGDYIGVAQTFYSQSGDKVADDTKPFSEVVYEKSPLNRLQKSGAPGVSWQPVDSDPLSTNDKTVKKRYELNGASEVYLFVYDPATGLTSTTEYYGASELVATKTLDEKNNDVIEYVDKEGHMICKKVKVNSTKYASTYYVYDDFGNLVVVIPPEALKLLLPSN